MVTHLELHKFGSAGTIDVFAELRETPAHGRTSILQAKDHGAVLLVDVMVWPNGRLNDDGLLTQHQRLLSNYY